MERLRELRKQKGLTTTELAKIIGCSNPTITNYERGYREPDFPTLSKLADYFGVTIDYLLGRDTIATAPSPTKKNTVISIGRGGERREYEISDEDAALVDAFLEKIRKKD